MTGLGTAPDRQVMRHVLWVSPVLDDLVKRFFSVLAVLVEELIRH